MRSESPSVTLQIVVATVALLSILFISQTVAAEVSNFAGASACLDIISACISATVLTASNDDTAYRSAQYGGFNPQNNVLTPSCIVQPTTTEDVAQAMRAIHLHKAYYAVRSGGHTGMEGWDSVDSGVLIDFSLMTAFSYNEIAQTVTVQPGLRWGEIYNLTEPYGASPMGGRVEHVGTGLILGAGLSLLSPQYGYACDGLLEAEVVLVNGSVVEVDATSDPGLLRAIKGGGGRFGIVTRYVLKAFPTGTRHEMRWYGGTITTRTEQGMAQMVQATEKFVATADDPSATLLYNVGMLKQAGLPQYVGIAMLFYKGTPDGFNRVFDDFLAIPNCTTDIKPMSYLDAAKVIPVGWTDKQAYKWIGGSLYASSSPSASASNVLATSWLSTYTNVLALIKKHESTLESAFWSLTPVRTTQINQGYAAGGNALSPPQGSNYMHYLFSTILGQGTTSFPTELEADRQKFLAENPSSEGLPLFLNEVDVQQKTFQSYGWFDELQEVYKRIDPEGFSLRHQQGPTF